jgi:uncharacterized membrane protein
LENFKKQETIKRRNKMDVQKTVETAVNETVETAKVVCSVKQNRLRSFVVWTAIAAELLSLGQLTGLFAKWGLDAGVAGNIVAGLLQLLVIGGILNNPTDAVNY